MEKVWRIEARVLWRFARRVAICRSIGRRSGRAGERGVCGDEGVTCTCGLDGGCDVGGVLGEAGDFSSGVEFGTAMGNGSCCVWRGMLTIWSYS
jgi:hypothetical protein